MAFWWPMAWFGPPVLSEHAFFPLWLGFILALDGLVERRTATSLLTRSPRKFVLLFAVSAPFWWYFELLNRYVQNWHYLQPHHLSTTAYIIASTLPFSTVVPAVLEMSELVAGFRVGSRLPQPGPWRLTGGKLIAIEFAGWISLVLTVLMPRYFFPFAWTSMFLIIEPLNVCLGQRSIGWFVERGRWEAIWNIALGTLATGVFWEMWNYYSMPKWVYTIPFVGFAHVFEMPVLGFGGYLPFGLEVFAVFGFAFWLVERRPQHYARVEAESVPEEARELQPVAGSSSAGGGPSAEATKPRQRQTGSRG